MGKRAADISGTRFGRWVVLSRAGSYRGKWPQWLCRCDCGIEKIVVNASLRSGMSKSCGCLQSDVARSVGRNRVTHGHNKRGMTTSTYRAWYNMIQRCTNPKNPFFYDYGGREIKVSNRWISFSNFLEDMGEKPIDTSLDRIDNNGGYSKENCRWASSIEQARNKRSNRLISFHGETHTEMEWSELLGIARPTLHSRLERGWSVEKALTTG